MKKLIYIALALLVTACNEGANVNSNQIILTFNKSVNLSDEELDNIKSRVERSIGLLNSIDVKKQKITLSFEDEVTKIGESAFNGCTSLTAIVIPNSVTEIGFAAFYGCTSLTSFNLPNSVTTIWERAFAGCTSLSSFSGKYASSDGRCLIMNGHLLGFAGAGLSEYSIPSSVTEIGRTAFMDCTSLTSIDIPSSITKIGDYAFRCCTSLTSVNIPDSVTMIGGEAFYFCTSLTSINIPDSVTMIGEGAFGACTSLTSFSGKYASSDGRCLIMNGHLLGFAGARLSGYSIPNSVTEIGSAAFDCCTSLTSIYIPNSVIKIGSAAFRYCTSLTSINFPYSVSEIGDYAFSNCTSLTSVDLWPSTRIGQNAFENCPIVDDTWLYGKWRLTINGETQAITFNSNGTYGQVFSSPMWGTTTEFGTYEIRNDRIYLYDSADGGKHPSTIIIEGHQLKEGNHYYVKSY